MTRTDPGSRPKPLIPGFDSLHSVVTELLPTWSNSALMLLIWGTVAAIGVADLAGGHEISMFAFYFIPISLGAWAGRRHDALLLAVSCAVLWLLLDTASHRTYSHEWVRFWNAMVRLVAFVSVAEMMSRIRILVERDRALQARLVNELHGLLPICSLCKRIRNDEGYWERVERYVAARSAATFTHGICPECSERHYPGPVA
jgi:hypothetical protein